MHFISAKISELSHENEKLLQELTVTKNQSHKEISRLNDAASEKVLIT